MTLKAFLCFIEKTETPRHDIETIRSLVVRFKSRRTQTSVDHIELDRFIVLLGTDRSGYVTLRDVVAHIKRDDRFERSRQAAVIMTRLKFKPRNIEINGVKTRCWVRGWDRPKTSKAIASGELPNLFPPPPPVPAPPCPVPLP